LLLYIFHVIMECDFVVHVRGCIHLQILNHSKHVTECHQTRLPLHTPHLLGHLCENLREYMLPHLQLVASKDWHVLMVEKLETERKGRRELNLQEGQVEW
jgi:hypothetical protein